MSRASVAVEISSLPGLPRDRDGSVFSEPWEAQAFALAVSLNARGAFTWGEWAATLAAEIKAAQTAGDPETSATYYHHWLGALERLVVAKGLATPQALHDTARAWTEAARATPHGQPIVLDPAQRNP